MSKWKGAVKAVGAVNKMGMLVKMRPPSAPTLIKQGHSMEAVAGSPLVRNLYWVFKTLSTQMLIVTKFI